MFEDRGEDDSEVESGRRVRSRPRDRSCSLRLDGDVVREDEEDVDEVCLRLDRERDSFREESLVEDSFAIVLKNFTIGVIALTSEVLFFVGVVGVS